MMSLETNKRVFLARNDGLPLIYVPKVPVGFLGNSSCRSDFC
jgi:hypothetical protein